jgi:hypothetical protein
MAAALARLQLQYMTVRNHVGALLGREFELTTRLVEEVKHMDVFLRSPTWVTTGFASKYAGPNGSESKCA